MDEPTETTLLAKELPTGQFLKLVLLGSVRSPVTGERLVPHPSTKKAMAVIGGMLPIFFLIIFFAGIAKPTWPNVIVFLVIVVCAYCAGVRSAKLVEKQS